MFRLPRDPSEVTLHSPLEEEARISVMSRDSICPAGVSDLTLLLGGTDRCSVPKHESSETTNRESLSGGILHRMNTAPEGSSLVVAADGKRSRLLLGEITRTDIVRFAGAGGDFNPIHHDEPFAIAQGYPSVFAMGMLTAGMGARLLTDWFGLTNLNTYSVRFASPVWPGESLTAEGVIEEGDADSPARIVLTVINQSGEKKISGTASIRSSALEKARGEGLTERSSLSANDDDPLAKRIGEVVHEVSFPIERGKIREYARAVKDPSRIFHDDGAALAAGYDRIPAPATFTNAAAHCGVGDASELPVRLGFDLGRTVHGEHSWTFHRVPAAGDLLSMISRISGIGARKNRSGQVMRLLGIRTDFSDPHGSLVVSEDMLIIELPQKI